MQSPETEPKHMTPAKMVAALAQNIKAADQSWQRWTALGHEIARRRFLASAQAHGTTRGPHYAEKLKAQFGQFYPHFKKLSDNGTLTSLDRCINQLDEVDAFRKTIPEDQRPAHPIRVWSAFNASQFATIDFSSDGSIATDENAKRPTMAMAKQGHNRDKDQLLRENDLLREELDGHKMTADATTNADRIWRRLVEARGHDQRTAELASETGQRLHEIAARFLEQPT